MLTLGQLRTEAITLPGLDILRGALLALPAHAQAPSCPVKVGGILPLTGSMAPITKKIAQAAELGIEHINQGGGIKGCLFTKLALPVVLLKGIVLARLHGWAALRSSIASVFTLERAKHLSQKN